MKLKFNEYPSWPITEALVAACIYIGIAYYNGMAHFAWNILVICLIASQYRRISEEYPDFGRIIFAICILAGVVQTGLAGSPDSAFTHIFAPWLGAGFLLLFFGRAIMRSIVFPGTLLSFPLTCLLSKVFSRNTYYRGPQAADRPTFFARDGHNSNLDDQVHTSTPSSATAVRRKAVGVTAGLAAGAAAAAYASDSDFAPTRNAAADINPATGLPTLGGMGTPDVAGNSWGTADAFDHATGPDSSGSDSFTFDSFSGSDDF